jgi:predicted ester cyclase
MLSADRLRELAAEHFAAENSRDLQAIKDTIHDDVGYYVKAPSYPDDPRPFGVLSGAEGYLQVWETLYAQFSDYSIHLDDVLPWPERNQALTLVTITATPATDFEGLPAGRPIRYSVAALVDFNDDGEMTAETVYGNAFMLSQGLRRMREFATAATAAAAADADADGIGTSA